MSVKLGLVNLSDFQDVNYVTLATELNYNLPLRYKFISTSYFLTPQIMSSINGDDASVITYLNTGLRITID